MKEIKVTTTITVKGDGEIETEVEKEVNAPDNEAEIAEEEAERYTVASDLANVCDYLEESEIIKIKLIIQKAQKRKEREEGA